MYKKLSALFAAIAIVTVPAMASAHVVVKPAETGVGTYPTFVTNVPVEKDMATIGVRLVIPAELKYVQPTVKPGWTIDEKTTGDGDFPTVTEISWTGGSIPPKQRDEFSFAAQVPAKAASLHWKAYQTYADGSVVAWDQDPTGKKDDDSTPYSVTKVIDDLKPAATAPVTTSSKSNNTPALTLGIVAVLVSIGGVLFRKK